MPTLNVSQIDRFLAAIEYPTDRDKLVKEARRRRTAQAFSSLLEQLPDDEFHAPANVRTALGRIEPSLATTPEPESLPGAQGAAPQNPLVDPIRGVADTARAQGGRLISQAGETLATRAERQKGSVTQLLAGAIETVRATGATAEQRGQRPVAQAADLAAQQLEAVSGYLERTDVREIARQAQDFARQQPWLELGVGVAIGLVATRFLRSAQLDQLAGGSSGLSMERQPT